MPLVDDLLKMALYAALILVVPGPTNTLLLSSGLKVGLRRTLPLVVAEALGYALSILLWGTFLLAFAASRPWLLDTIKLLCAAYLLWLAIKLWKNSRLIGDDARRPATFPEVFLATLLNPKAFLFASTVFPLSAFQSAPQLAGFMAAFLLVLAPIATLWSSLGNILTAHRAWSRHTGTLLRSASLLLALFSASIAYSALAHKQPSPPLHARALAATT